MRCTGRERAMQDREKEAKEVLEQIYTDNIEKHYQKVVKDKNAVAAHGNPTMMDMFSPKYRKAFLVVIFVMSGIQFCGFSPIFMFFNVFIAESADNDAGTISVFATMMGVISLIASILANVFVERFGRRPLLTYGMGLMCISQGLYAFIGYVGGSGNPLLTLLLENFQKRAFKISAKSTKKFCSDFFFEALEISLRDWNWQDSPSIPSFHQIFKNRSHFFSFYEQKNFQNIFSKFSKQKKNSKKKTFSF